jgi:hypothetical protein
MHRTLHIAALSALLTTMDIAPCRAGDPIRSPQVEVTFPPAVEYMNVRVFGEDPIGRVLIEIIDYQGRTYFHEESATYTSEVIRRLRKDAFPKRPLIIRVMTQRFEITRPFSIS